MSLVCGASHAALDLEAAQVVQAGGVDLARPASGCQGVFPRVVQWDGDGRKDLVVGLADGRLRLYANIATNAAPAFDAGVFLLRAGIEIDVGYRATPLFVSESVVRSSDRSVVGGRQASRRYARA